MAVSEVRALQRLKNDQAAASDPHRHVWLSASAGSGKTHVLSARVFRLLLRGVDPAAILCLTFTKAGAAEMAERVASRLARWVRLPTADLKADLFALGEDVNDGGRGAGEQIDGGLLRCREIAARRDRAGRVRRVEEGEDVGLRHEGDQQAQRHAQGDPHETIRHRQPQTSTGRPAPRRRYGLRSDSLHQTPIHPIRGINGSGNSANET